MTRITRDFQQALEMAGIAPSLFEHHWLRHRPPAAPAVCRRDS
jgi:hypothetical protein